MIHESQIAAKVAAVNAVNEYAMRLYPVLADYFRPYVGQKIEKADGSLLKKIADKMPALPTPIYHCYRSPSRYSLMWAVKACESYKSSSRWGSDDQHACYYETGVYIGKMDDGVLVSIQESADHYLDNHYTIDEVVKRYDALVKARKAFDAAQSAMHPFEEKDFR